MELYIIIFLIGLIVGIILSDKLELGDVINYVNEIGKLKTKGDASPISTSQQTDVLQHKKEKKKGFLNRLLTKKSKS